MLQEILMHLHNWFVVPRGIHHGDFDIKDGGMALPFLSDGQYFRVVGSVFNDGLHQYPAADMADEAFTGAVWALAIPKEVVSIADEIAAWSAKNAPSAYTSESFGGYSYSKATGASGAPIGWREVFADRLAPYRKPMDVSYVRGQWYQPPYEPFSPNPWR